VDRGLLMARIDDAEVLVRHRVQHRQDVIAGQSENVVHAFELKRSADQPASRNSRH
jgi:hypothetical protein